MAEYMGYTDARTTRERTVSRESFFFETNREKVHREFLRETRDLEDDARRDGTTTFARGGDDDDGCDDGDGRRLDRVSRMWRRNEERESDTAGAGDDARVFDHGERAGRARGGCPREDGRRFAFGSAVARRLNSDCRVSASTCARCRGRRASMVCFESPS